MKRIILALLLIAILLTSCGQPSETSPSTETNAQTESDVAIGIETETEIESESTTETDTPAECQHTQTEDQGEKAGIFTEGYSKLICKDCGTCVSEGVVPATKTIRILAIGNSFSRDAIMYLYDLLTAAGVEKVVIADAFISGCTLQTHYENSVSGAEAYSYTKYSSSGKDFKKPTTLDKIVTDEDWDIITLQQASKFSGMPEEYAPYLGNMINYVKTTATNPDVDIKFHMTWAYHASSNNGHFEKYNDNQMTMYQSIVDAATSEVLTRPEITGVIPAGTAIQNLRTSYIGDTLHRDESTHLTYDIGCYTVGLTWACYLTGLSPYDIDWHPTGKNYKDVAIVEGSIESAIDVIREAVVNALETPFAVTPSSTPVKHTEWTLEQFEKAGLNIDDYTVVDWEAKPQYCWNSTKNAKTTKTSGYLYYTASRMFTKEELPVGSVIVVDSGYQYRPEGWVALDQVNASADRPKNTSTTLVVVTEEWWGKFNYRAFNVSSVSDKSNATNEVVQHFTIYVPKN